MRSFKKYIEAKQRKKDKRASKTSTRLKYKNQSTRVGDEYFPSKLEAEVYRRLKDLELAKEIKDLKRQVRVKLTRAQVLYIVDFSFADAVTDEVTYVEAKGYRTDVWRLKLRLWRFYGPGHLEVWVGSYKSPRIDEIVVPTGPKPRPPGILKVVDKALEEDY